MGGSPKVLGELRRLVVVRVQVASKVERQKNQYGHTDPDRVKAPIFAVRPNGKTANERYDYHHREDE
jgi:hypothetical protein